MAPSTPPFGHTSSTSATPSLIHQNYITKCNHPSKGGTTEEPISRTYQYRKVMKPMLERKRRARINRCLDELKELMVTALQNDGENVAKLEKADILELTVRHLHSLRRHHRQISLVGEDERYLDRFRAGFSQCAQEVSQFLSSDGSVVFHQGGEGGAGGQLPLSLPRTTSAPSSAATQKLLQHLGACVRQMDAGAHHRMRNDTPERQINGPPPENAQNTQMWRPW